MKQIFHKFSIIINNPKNLNCILDALEKTLKNKTINVELNFPKSHELKQIALNIKNNNVWEEHTYSLMKVDLSNSEDMEKFYGQLLSFCNESVRRVPYIKTKYGYEISQNSRKSYIKALPQHESILYSLIRTWSEKSDSIDVFDMATDLFIKMAETQCLPNGNKRHAVLITNLFLSEFRLYCVGSYLNMSQSYLEDWIELVTISATKYDRIYTTEELDKFLHQKDNPIKHLDYKTVHNMVKKHLRFVTFFGLFEQKSLDKQLLLIEYKGIIETYQ